MPSGTTAPVLGAVPYTTLSAVIDRRKAEAESLVAHGVDRADVYGVIMSAAHCVRASDLVV